MGRKRREIVMKTQISDTDTLKVAQTEGHLTVVLLKSFTCEKLYLIFPLYKH